jgi:hypothetical protein
MRNVLIASMATAALFAAACTQTSLATRGASTGAVLGAEVAAMITEPTKHASSSQ